MNKESFLEELRGYLQVLEDQEQEDILEEYAQHIDMKLQKGLSEEEAIRDFGPMKELAAGILEAYHVKPEYRQKRIVVRLPDWKRDKGEKTARSNQGPGRMGNFLKGKFMAVSHGIKNGLRWLWGKCKAFAGWLMKPWRGRKTGMHDIGGEEKAEAWEGMAEGAERQAAAGQDQGNALGNRMAVKGGGNMRKGMKSFFQTAGQGLAGLWGGFLKFCTWWICLCWNISWLLVSLLFAAMAMAALAGFGTLLVLLFQGYPLLGFLLISLGCILCFGALACGAFSLRIKRDSRHAAGPVSA